MCKRVMEQQHKCKGLYKKTLIISFIALTTVNISLYFIFNTRCKLLYQLDFKLIASEGLNEAFDTV